MASTRTLVALVAGLGGVVALASGASASSLPAARPSRRRTSNVPQKQGTSPSTPKGVVTLGPLTSIKTDPKTGKVTRTTYSNDPMPGELLTPAQAEALEDKSVQQARAQMDPSNATQQERAKRAAQRARQLMSPKSVPPIPLRPPSNPSVRAEPEQERGDDQPLAYVSPPTHINLEAARKAAPQLARHIRNAGSTDAARRANYSRQSVRQFQAHAGITVDGIYGPLTASALKYFGVSSPPAALFKAAPGTVTIYAPA